MDKHTISQAKPGDPFTSQDQRSHNQERPCACYEGVVYIGHMVESEEDGEEVEVIEAVPCRRCADDKGT